MSRLPARCESAQKDLVGDPASLRRAQKVRLTPARSACSEPMDPSSVATGLAGLSPPRDSKQWVRLTRVCNDNCTFCLDKGNLDGVPISFEEITLVLQRGRSAGVTRAVLSGGEPTLSPFFFDAVREAKTMGYERVQVVTNGRMFAYRSFLQNALDAGLDEVTFSIPSHRKEEHDRLTQTKGSFRETLAGLCRSLEARTLIVNVNIVVTRTNLPFLREMILFLHQLGVREFDLLYPRPFGAAWENKEAIFFSVEEALPYLEPVFSLIRRRDMRIWVNKFPKPFLQHFPELETPREKIWDELEFREEFARFRQTGEPMWCFGPRCRYCFFQSTCHSILQAHPKSKEATTWMPA